MGIRPSLLLDIQDGYQAYCIDEAVLSFGHWVQSKLSGITGKNDNEVSGRQELMLRKLLSGDAKEQFAVPVATK